VRGLERVEEMMRFVAEARNEILHRGGAVTFAAVAAADLRLGWIRI